jgi:hypothetical protein
MVRKAIQVRELLVNRIGGVFLPEHGWFFVSIRQPFLVNRAMPFRQRAASPKNLTSQSAREIFRAIEIVLVLVVVLVLD